MKKKPKGKATGKAGRGAVRPQKSDAFPGPGSYAERTVPLASIEFDPGLQQRDGGINEGYVLELATALKAGDTLPPVTVFADPAADGRLWLADGFSRAAAYDAAGRTEIPARVYVGGRREALLYSLGANAAHGLRRTNADKRKAVFAALNDPELFKKKDRELGRLCKVEGSWVSRLRKELTGAAPDPVKSRNGRKGNQVRFERPEPPAPTPAGTPAPATRSSDVMATAAVGQLIAAGLKPAEAVAESAAIAATNGSLTFSPPSPAELERQRAEWAIGIGQAVADAVALIRKAREAVSGLKRQVSDEAFVAASAAAGLKWTWEGDVYTVRDRAFGDTVHNLFECRQTSQIEDFLRRLAEYETTGVPTAETAKAA